MKKCIETEKKFQHTDEDPIYYDYSDLGALHEILETPRKITHFIQNRGDKNMFQILIIIDDFAYDPALAHHSKMFHTPYIRGRHNMISTITVAPKFNSIHPTIRANATELFVHRLRSMKDV